MSLVLGRKEGSGLCIGDSIRVTVLSIRKESVRLSIDAPPDVPVDRDELRAEKERERAEWAKFFGADWDDLPTVLSLPKFGV